MQLNKSKHFIRVWCGYVHKFKINSFVGSIKQKIDVANDGLIWASLHFRSRKKRAHFGKSTSEPNLPGIAFRWCLVYRIDDFLSLQVLNSLNWYFDSIGHFTPRFPDNLSHLIHEYVTVDELKFYRKRRPPNVGDGNETKPLHWRRQCAACLANLTDMFVVVFVPKNFTTRTIFICLMKINHSFHLVHWKLNTPTNSDEPTAPEADQFPINSIWMPQPRNC